MGNLLSKPETPLRITGSTVKSFNMWNEQWEVGALDVATGEKITDSGCIRTKDYIAVTPGTKVYLRCSAANIRPCWYNSNKAFVNSPSGLSNTVYTIPQGIYFMKFYQRVSPTTYQHDICINISQPDTTVSPHNGEYVAYFGLKSVMASGIRVNGVAGSGEEPFLLDFGQTVSLDSIGGVKDEIGAVKQSDGTWNIELVKRIGEVDLGTLWFQSMTYGGHTLFYTQNQSQVPNTTNYICSIYNTVGGITNMPDLSITGAGGGGTSIWIRDDSCATAQDLRTKLNSVSLKYRLKNSTVTTLYTGLTDDDISYMLSLHGPVEVLGNTGSPYAQPGIYINPIVEIGRLITGKSVYSIDDTAAILPASLAVAQLDKLNWQRSGTANPFVAQIPIPGKPSNQSSLLCTMYPRSSINNISEQMPDKTVIIRNNNIYIKDTTTASVEAFTNKIKNIIIIYQRQEAE